MSKLQESTVKSSVQQQTLGQVLVVDDEAMVRDLVCRWLTDAGYACKEAENVADAKECLQTHNIDLITLDIQMPGMSGLEFLHQLVQFRPDMPVIMLTGNDQSHSAIDALTSGAAGYLLKPIQQEELLFHVNRARERQRLLAEKQDYLITLEHKVRQQTIAIRRAHEETIHRLVVASCYRDGETGAHIWRTGKYAEILAKSVGWPETEAEHIRLAAPMHDIGKVCVPDRILCKPGKLTAEEREFMEAHTVAGAQILAGSDSPILQIGEKIARWHHEHWDGQGYPDGIHGEEIPECARITAIVDVYDALTHDRVYRPAFAREKALCIMRDGRGTDFDPRLLDKFFEILPAIEEISRETPEEHISPLITDSEYTSDTVVDRIQMLLQQL